MSPARSLKKPRMTREILQAAKGNFPSYIKFPNGGVRAAPGLKKRIPRSSIYRTKSTYDLVEIWKSGKIFFLF